MGVDTGFRGSHRDAAMPPPSADHACMEDRDPHPCPEDEEFFECRPDAADMEEAIGRFMEGMEEQECTGYVTPSKCQSIAFMASIHRYQFISIGEHTRTYLYVRVYTSTY